MDVQDWDFLPSYQNSEVKYHKHCLSFIVRLCLIKTNDKKVDDLNNSIINSSCMMENAESSSRNETIENSFIQQVSILYNIGILALKVFRLMIRHILLQKIKIIKNFYFMKVLWKCFTI